MARAEAAPGPEGDRTMYANQFADNPLNRTLGHAPAGIHDLLNGNTHAAVMQLTAKLDEICRTQAQQGEMLATIERTLRNLRRRS